MDSLRAFATGEANKTRESMVFDWNKAATIIKEQDAQHAGAGLSDDWEWTGGTILKDGKPLSRDETYTYLASTWATPELEIDGEKINCYKMQSKVPAWGYDTYWPQSALDILEKK